MAQDWNPKPQRDSIEMHSRRGFLYNNDSSPRLEQVTMLNLRKYGQPVGQWKRRRALSGMLGKLRHSSLNERFGMSYRIYKQDNDGLHLVKSGATYAETEYYRQFCGNIVVRDEETNDYRVYKGRQIVKDSANDLPSDLDRVKPSQYGVADSRVMESATVLFACIGGGAILLIGAIVYNTITGG